MNECIAERDCIKVPISDKCITFCANRALMAMTVEEKKLILGFDDDLISNIYDAYNKHGARTFGDLLDILRSDEIKTILTRFQTINQFQLDYLNNSSWQRKEIQDAIKKLKRIR